jgi:plastocyanin
VVRLTEQGPVPKTLTVRAGDTVTFRNVADIAYWPASNPHPTHTDCPGFDALRGLKIDESYTLTFAQVRTCGYHNHLDPANSSAWGTIIVQ